MEANDSEHRGNLLREALLEYFRNTSDYMFVKDTNYIYTGASESFAKLLGLDSASQVIGRTDYDLFDMDLADKYRNDDRKVLEEGRAISGMLEGIPPVDGVPQWAKTWKHTIKDQCGNPVGLYGVSRNITDQMRLETDNQRMIGMIEGVPGGMAVYHATGKGYRLLAVNSYLRRLLRTEPVAVISPEQQARIMNSVHPDDAAESDKWLARLFSGTRPEPFLFRCLTGTGRYLWLKADGSPVKNKDGSVTAYVLYTDATDQKRREDEFDARIRDLFKTGPNAISISRIDLTANRILSDFSRDSESGTYDAAVTAESYFRSFLETICKDSDRASCADMNDRSRLTELFLDGRRSLHYNYRIYDTDTLSPKWETRYINLLQNPRNDHVEAIIYTFDTNDSIINKLIVDRVADIDYDYVAIINRENRTVKCFIKDNSDPESIPRNTVDYDQDIIDSAIRMYGEDDTDQFIQSLCFSTIIRELDSSPAGRYVYSINFPEKNGIIPRKQYRYSWLDESHDTIMFTRADITQSYQVEVEQLRRTEQALHDAENANRAKTDFISRISHDIRTPINAIMNMTAFAVQDADSRDLLLRDLNRIETSTSFLMSLINDVLDISKIDSDKISLRKEVCHIDDFLSGVSDLVEPMCRQKDIDFTVMKGNVDAPRILADKARLNQITFNLLSNSVKYTPPGGCVKLLAGVKKGAGYMSDCFIIVSDNGIGMSEEFQKTMYEPFTQEHSGLGHTSFESGTGLGLSIVRRIVDLMGGTISVHSSPGMGTQTTVHFSAPIAEEGMTIRDPLIDEASPSDIPASSVMHGKVLVAEDNEINMEITARFLESFGLEFDRASNGAETVEKFRSSEPGHYDMIIMDIQMPVMNGYDAASAIRALSRNDARLIPIIAMTADAFDESIEKSRRCGMNAHITKPVDPARLKATLYHYLNA